MARLRDPERGCEWDTAQTFETIAPYTIEEAYEVADAIDREDFRDLREELGDLLLQPVYHAQMATEAGHFTINDVISDITEKMITRHPHVFGQHDGNKSMGDINHSWEVAKQKEKERDNILDGVPKSLPALVRARRIQEKAANVGFDWKESLPILNKIEEEFSELKEAMNLQDSQMIKDEMGDVLFSLVNLSRFLNINPEDSLRMAILKFENRFSEVEKELKKRGKSLSDSSLEEMDEIWNLVKKRACA